ncbi:MAG: universal stress protein [Bacteroidetes bacterium]|nr:universal stress protein [Bacteroidota bacterium]
MAHLLVPTDFSEAALNAAAYALRTFDAAADRFTLVHAYLDATPGNTVWPGASQELYQASMDGMAVFKKRVRALKGAAEADIREVVLFGPIGGVLADVQREEAVDLVVMGTKGASGVPLFSSNAAHIAKTSRVPVLVVPEGAGAAPIRRILLADDREEHSEGALRTLVHLAQRQEAEVVVAHVGLEEERGARMGISSFSEALARVRHRMVHVIGEDPVEALLELAVREEVDLLAVLHRHTTFVDALFHRSTTKQLALRSPTPVLVLED